jgi:hypothetical protein
MLPIAPPLANARLMMHKRWMALLARYAHWQQAPLSFRRAGRLIA